MKKAYLLLADGTLFEGTAVGYEGQSIGEVVFINVCVPISNAG